MARPGARDSWSGNHVLNSKYVSRRANASSIPTCCLKRLSTLSNRSLVDPYSMGHCGHCTACTSDGSSAMGSYAQLPYSIRGATIARVPSQRRRLSLKESDGSTTRSMIASGKYSPAVAILFAGAERGFAIPTALKVRFSRRGDLRVSRFRFEFDALRMGKVLV